MVQQCPLNKSGPKMFHNNKHFSPSGKSNALITRPTRLHMPQPSCSYQKEGLRPLPFTRLLRCDCSPQWRKVAGLTSQENYSHISSGSPGRQSIWLVSSVQTCLSHSPDRISLALEPPHNLHRRRYLERARDFGSLAGLKALLKTVALLNLNDKTVTFLLKEANPPRTE